MSDSFKAWVDLAESDIRSMLIALIGYDFGAEPERRMPEIRESRKSFSNYIADRTRISTNDVVMDLGSGCGFGTYWLAKRARHVHGCDISSAYLSFARRECSDLENVSFHRIESRNLAPIGANSIDVVCSMSVFIHLNLYDIYWYFKEFKRVVKPAGRIWIDFADSESIDLGTPNQNGKLFLQHANEYAANPNGLPGYMFWNSSAAIVGIASHFGFDCAEKIGGELVFVNGATPL